MERRVVRGRMKRMRRRTRSLRLGWSRTFSVLLAPWGESGFHDGTDFGPNSCSLGLIQLGPTSYFFWKSSPFPSSAYLESSLLAVLVFSPSTRSGRLNCRKYFQIIFRWKYFESNLQVILWRVLFLFHHLNNHWTRGHDAKHIWGCWKWVVHQLLLNELVEIDHLGHVEIRA